MPSSASSSLSLETNSLTSSNNLNSNNDLNQPHGDEIYGFTSGNAFSFVLTLIAQIGLLPSHCYIYNYLSYTFSKRS